MYSRPSSPNVNAIVAVRMDMLAVKVCCNKIPQFLTRQPANTGWPVVVVVVGVGFCQYENYK